MKKIKVILLLLTFIGILIGYGVVAVKAFKLGETACQKEVLASTVKSEEIYAKVKKKTMSLDDAALRKRYCKWVRDDKELCLQANIPISVGSGNPRNDATNNND